MGIAAVHDDVGRLQLLLEETLVRLDRQFGRMVAADAGKHPVGGHDRAALETKAGHELVGCLWRSVELARNGREHARIRRGDTLGKHVNDMTVTADQVFVEIPAR